MPSQPLTTGIDLLRSPSLNKSTAFSEEEREQYNLKGLLPPAVGSMNTQLERVLANLRRKGSDIEKYIFLSALQDRNERLFYRLIMEHFQEITPLIYTPTVGQACKEFANIFRMEKGFYITAQDKGQVADILKNWPERDVKIVVVSDGERILGLGDLGANGMGIPIGKLSLYCACAGISPRQTLPIMFDVGTNNEELLHDPIYLGLRQKRLSGEPYIELMDELVDSLTEAYPEVLIQFEDFAAGNAYNLLNRYRDTHLCFNDDIQGTASVVLAGVIAASRISGVPFKDAKFTFLGAGSAASGIGSLIAQALIKEGLSEKEAYERLWFFNRGGLVRKDRTDLSPHILAFAHDQLDYGFLEGLEVHQPDFLIGATGTPNTFNQEIVSKLVEIKQRPGIFALSNPTSRAECSAEEAYQWSDGRAIFASGSPFSEVQYKGQVFRPGQGNNSYIFPGVGLGMISCKAKKISDEVFLEAAYALSSSVTEADLMQGAIYPQIDEIRKVSLNIATAVAKYAYHQRLAEGPSPVDLRSFIAQQMYDPSY